MAETTRKRIEDLAAAARGLEPGFAERADLNDAITAHAAQFLERLARAPAYQTPRDPSAAAHALAVDELGTDLTSLLATLDTFVERPGIETAGAGHLGYIPGGGLYHAALGDYLAAVSNRFVGLNAANPGAVSLETTLLRWLADTMGLPASAAGTLTSGGSTATLTAFVAARDAAGLSDPTGGAPVVYATAHAHHCVAKALHVIGQGAAPRRDIPTDAEHRMDAAALAAAIAADRRAGLRPWLIIATAGTTNTGAIDPLPAIADIAVREGLWLHIDAAYGGLFALCEEGRAVLDGLARGDSLVLDPHKSLFLPYGTGAVLVRDGAHLARALSGRADYLAAEHALDQLSPSDLSLELSRHFRGLRLWLPLKLLGVAPFRAALAEKMHLARYFAARLRTIPGFEVGPDPALSIVTFRFLPASGDADGFNRRLEAALRDEGTAFFSTTRLDDRLVLRAAILSFRTHLAHIDAALDAIQRTARRLDRGGGG